MHIPFPTSQIFRELNFSPQILESLLSATLIGFHAFDHARHFINASKRILGIPTYRGRVGGLIGLDTNSRYKSKSGGGVGGGEGGGNTNKGGCYVCMSHVSVEGTTLDKAIGGGNFWKDVEGWRKAGNASLSIADEQPSSKRLLIGSIDVAQKLSGIPLKLLTFETLLRDYPVWKQKVSSLAQQTQKK